MNIADIRSAQAKLSEELFEYIAFNANKIAAVTQKVQDNGSEGAVDGEARVENARHATVSEGVFLEATVRGDDKAPINFLERGLRASRAVARIVDSNRRPLGTGFLVGPGLMMTNNHVLSSMDDAEGCMVEFDYEENADETALPVQRFDLVPGTLFVTSDRSKLDFTLVAVAERSREGTTLAPRGWLPLDERRNKIFEGQPIVIIQHPDGQMKQICLFDSVLTWRDDTGPFLLYSTDTAEGTSGSPCFNRFWQVVALHHASMQTDKIDENGRPVAINRGIRISAIFAALAIGTDISGDATHIATVLRILTDPATRRSGRPFAPLSTPLVISEPMPPVGIPALEGSGTIIRVKTPADFLDSRKGYDPAFLGTGTKSIPLPQLPGWLSEDTVRLTNDPDEAELKYQHFSIVMSKSRRLALFTATNVEGAESVSIDRKDRNPDAPLDRDVHPEAAADRWFFDPRIAESDQVGPRVYDTTTFDYGHLVRRLDPVWGNERTLRIANDDTFYMTNCAPHEVRFHRTRRGAEISWSTLEDLVLNAARTSKKKFTVLTGPVLDARDPIVGGLKIPLAFWKIAAFVLNGKLKAYGYMLWQRREVDTMAKPAFEGLESLDEERPFAIREIARLTGLDFGPLFEADILA